MERPLMRGGLYLAVGWFGLALLILPTACDRPQVRVYLVEKDLGRPRSAESPTDGNSGLRWTQPENWSSVPPGPIRTAAFVVSGPSGQRAEISVVRLNIQTVNELDNFNRWRAQVGLPPGNEEEMAKCIQPVKVGGVQGKLFEIAGNPEGTMGGLRVIVAVVQRGQTAWFFKMIGDDELVSAQRAVFTGFLESIEYVD
ncbi:MAG: hypothetical protein N3G20_03555 [Verrucomicrobiae bacterium]|nr:hypothetical protein [Verrucomicrobiae bacterium]